MHNDICSKELAAARVDRWVAMKGLDYVMGTLQDVLLNLKAGREQISHIFKSCKPAVCPFCHSSQHCRFRYLNNINLATTIQPRYSCHKCKELFTLGSAGYAKKRKNSTTPQNGIKRQKTSHTDSIACYSNPNQLKDNAISSHQVEVLEDEDLLSYAADLNSWLAEENIEDNVISSPVVELEEDLLSYAADLNSLLDEENIGDNVISSLHVETLDDAVSVGSSLKTQEASIRNGGLDEKESEDNFISIPHVGMLEFALSHLPFSPGDSSWVDEENIQDIVISTPDMEILKDPFSYSLVVSMDSSLNTQEVFMANGWLAEDNVISSPGVGMLEDMFTVEELLGETCCTSGSDLY
ncbi:hypothetical protein SUGI_0072400 [Cryptomeria japonica]|nr:hypothetical protein SUGI_0072400 [Cryptomeria japonica]